MDQGKSLISRLESLTSPSREIDGEIAESTAEPLIIRRVPVTADVVTVLGHKWKDTDPAWRGLDFANAEPRVQASIMLAVCGENAPPDIHLNVPFCHPDDQTGSPDDFDCIYRVRPQMEAGKEWNGELVKWVAFERWNWKWFIAYAIMRAREGKEKTND